MKLGPTVIWIFSSRGRTMGSQEAMARKEACSNVLTKFVSRQASLRTRELKIPEFSGDGRYLTHYAVHEFTETLGTPEDDVTNTFTARLLLHA